MKKPASLARRLSHVSAKEKTAKPIEITEIVEGAQCAAAYIAQLTGVLATLANGARFANLAHLLARAPLEAELWSLSRQMTTAACFLALNTACANGMPLWRRRAAPRAVDSAVRFR